MDRLFYATMRSGWDKIYNKQAFWTKSMDPDSALATTRVMLTLGDETVVENSRYPLLRSQNPGISLHSPNGRPLNVVIILMESLSARYVGALGALTALTPEFDRLAERGVLFERAFSNGTHTHQGVYATLTSFPNLPGYEYLMKMMESNQEFSGLPTLLRRHDYQSLFLYNGLFSWENKEGFFRRHGMDRFIGTSDLMLLVVPKKKPRFYRYHLGFPPGSSEDLFRKNEDLVKQMENRLLAYVKTGILALRNRRLGTPEREAIAVGRSGNSRINPR